MIGEWCRVSRSYVRILLAAIALPNCSVFLLSMIEGIVPPMHSSFPFVRLFLGERLWTDFVESLGWCTVTWKSVMQSGDCDLK